MHPHKLCLTWIQFSAYRSLSVDCLTKLNVGYTGWDSWSIQGNFSWFPHPVEVPFFSQLQSSLGQPIIPYHFKCAQRRKLLEVWTAFYLDSMSNCPFCKLPKKFRFPSCSWSVFQYMIMSLAIPVTPSTLRKITSSFLWKTSYEMMEPIGSWPIHFITEDNSDRSVWVNISTRRQVCRLLLGYDELHCALGMCIPEPALGMTKYS